MKVFLLSLLFLYMTACTTSPVKKEVGVPPKKNVVKPEKPFLKHVQKEDKSAFDEIKDDKRILHIHSTEMSKATKKVDFWATIDPEEFNTQFHTNLYTKDGNDYVYKVCSTAKQDKLLLLDFLNYDSIIDDKEEIYELASSKEMYGPLIVKHVDASIGYCRDFKEILCSKKAKKGWKRVSKKSLMKDLQNPHLDEPSKQKLIYQMYELTFCEATKTLK